MLSTGTEVSTLSTDRLSQADVDVLAVVGGEALQQMIMIANDEGPGSVRERGELQHAPDVLRLHARLRTVGETGDECHPGNQRGGGNQTDGLFADHRVEDLRLDRFPPPARLLPDWAARPVDEEEALLLRGWV